MLGCKRLKRMRKMTAFGFGLKWHMWPFILPHEAKTGWVVQNQTLDFLTLWSSVLLLSYREFCCGLWHIVVVVCSYLISILLTATVRNVESLLQNEAGKKVKNILTLSFLRGTGFLFILVVSLLSQAQKSWELGKWSSTQDALDCWKKFSFLIIGNV